MMVKTKEGIELQSHPLCWVERWFWIIWCYEDTEEDACTTAAQVGGMVIMTREEALSMAWRRCNPPARPLYRIRSEDAPAS